MKALTLEKRMAAAFSSLAPGLIWAVFSSCRKVHIGSRAGYLAMTGRVPHICAMWHQRIFMLLPENAPRGPVVMVSRSADGEIAARAMRRMGYVLARGSSTRGGIEALQEVIEAVQGGRMAGMVADGPRGPARVLKMGAVVAARESGTELCGITAASSRPMYIRSWDRTEIPMPFSTIVFGYTEPFAVPKGLPAAQYESMRERLERELEAVDARSAELARRIGRGERF